MSERRFVAALNAFACLDDSISSEIALSPNVYRICRSNERRNLNDISDRQ